MEKPFGTTIDAFASSHDFPIPNYIKIDVDGIGKEVIKGARNTLSNEAVRSVLIEVRPDDHGQQEWACTNLRKAGLSLRSRSTRSRGAPNFIFFRD